VRLVSTADGPSAAETTMGEREFRELADNAPVMIWRSRPDKLCDWFNRPWQEFSGKTIEQLFGYGWAEDVHPDDFGRCVETYTTAFDARESFTMPYRLRRHDGEYRWFLDNGAPYYRNGAFAGYFGSCIDITEQLALQEHQRTLLAELKHRVNNNLQLVVSFLQLEKRRTTNDEAKGILQNAIRRMRGVGVVHEQLHHSATSHVDLGDYLPRLARAVLEAECGDSAVLVAETQGVRVPFKLASNLGLILNELITNAVKHGDGATRPIRLRIVRIDPDMAELSVHDAGPGFAPALLADGTRSSGMGAGLIDALARGVQATPVRENVNGARVTLRFPVPAVPSPNSDA
jgi:PAS domain S-box-containing protein